MYPPELSSTGQATAVPAVLVTKRLVLEPISLKFASALFGHFNDWEVVRWLVRAPLALSAA